MSSAAYRPSGSPRLSKDAVAVWPAACTDGCREEACCSLAAESVAAPAQRRRLSRATDSIWATLTAQRSACSWRASAKARLRRGKETEAAPYLARQMSESGLRRPWFKLWGVIVSICSVVTMVILRPR